MSKLQQLAPTDRFLIYGLKDPRDGRLRYVGQSSTGMQRPRSHLQPSSAKEQNPHFRNWISNLKKSEISYTIEVIARLFSAAELDDAEVYWIKTLRTQGLDLLNYSDGGGASGLAGKSLSAEHRLALKAGWIKRKAKGLLRSRASYEAQAIKTKGRKQSSEWVENRARKLRGRTLSDAQKQRISATLKDRPATEGTAKNLRSYSARMTPEYRIWLSKRGAASRWKKEFTDPEPEIRYYQPVSVLMT
jgi:hypothetical protein